MNNATLPLLMALVSFPLLGIPAALNAAEKPAATEAWKVVSYYFDGESLGPVLMDSRPCLKVDNEKGSATRYECVQPVNGPVAKGTYVSAWTKWLVPKGGDYEDVMIQFLHNGMVRSTKDVKLTESLRMRVYRTEQFTKAGQWEIRVLRGTTLVKSHKVTVTE